MMMNTWLLQHLFLRRQRLCGSGNSTDTSKAKMSYQME